MPLLPAEFLKDTAIHHIHDLPKKWLWFYLVILAIIISSICALPYFYIPISISTTGFIRPAQERSVIKSSITAIIDSIFCSEGSFVTQNQTIFTLKNYTLQQKLENVNQQISLSTTKIKNLNLLIKNVANNKPIANELISLPMYAAQFQKYYSQKKELEISLQQAQQILAMNKPLFTEKIISRKEFNDLDFAVKKLENSISTLKQQQINVWQNELQQCFADTQQYNQQISLMFTDTALYQIKAPVAGFIQGINDKYIGSLVQPNDLLASISPEVQLIAECYISTKDIGLVKPNQLVIFQLDAFDYKYFGSVSGKVLSIDNDFQLVNNTPVFKVRCSLDKNYVQLNNGYKGVIKKGLSFTARFMITKRSLWQLLFDTLNDWLNPQQSLHFNV